MITIGPFPALERPSLTVMACPSVIFSRPIKYGLKNEPYLSKKQQIDRVYNFVQNKFGRNGYVKYWLDIDDTKKEQEEVWNLLDNEPLCKQYIEGLFDEITKGKYN